MKILVTGARGRIGQVVLADLLSRGYTVRATSSKPVAEVNDNPLIEWQRADFMDSVDFDQLVDGCDAILHLAAEIHAADRMERLNVDTTRKLAEAAERADVKSFCYVSSVAVYGSAKHRIVTESSPVLTSDQDIRSEYWVVDYVRKYGRTKLAGEQAISRVASTCRYTVLRPTVVVDASEILSVRDWSKLKRIMAAHRHAHHIYIRDVSLALIWALERGLKDDAGRGNVDIFNLADDDLRRPSYADFMREAFAVSGDARFDVFSTPPILDWIRDFLRHRSLPVRNPLWRMYFQSDHIRGAGFEMKFGMEKANRLALDTLKSESQS